MKKLPTLLYADSEKSADMLYFGRFNAPDPFVACELDGKKVALLNALEFGRGKKESGFDLILPLEIYQQKVRDKWKNRAPGIAEVICVLAEEHGVKAFCVPDDFPAGLAMRLHKLGIQIAIADGEIFPEREIKSRKEAAAIREGNNCACQGFAAAEKLLRSSRIKDGFLTLKGERLTSEKLKFHIEVACLEAGGLSLNTIAAGGDQACDPHCRGTGPLKANELIIVDIFPRMQETGFHGDMTRTFLRGRANDAQHALVDAVRSAQLGALKAIRADVNGRDVHRGVVAEFEKRGYQTKRDSKGAVGFFHGTGHGLGLAIHEMPRLSGVMDYRLPKGSVVTVEPGLYYPGLGACRIEDVVQVNARGSTLLSDYHYEWELR